MPVICIVHDELDDVVRSRCSVSTCRQSWRAIRRTHRRERLLPSLCCHARASACVTCRSGRHCRRLDAGRRVCGIGCALRLARRATIPPGSVSSASPATARGCRRSARWTVRPPTPAADRVVRLEPPEHEPAGAFGRGDCDQLNADPQHDHGIAAIDEGCVLVGEPVQDRHQQASSRRTRGRPRSRRRRSTCRRAAPRFAPRNEGAPRRARRGRYRGSCWRRSGQRPRRRPCRPGRRRA